MVPTISNNNIDGLLSSLAGMPGARKETQQSVRFPAEEKAIREAIENIKRLQGTGQLRINFADGKPNGLVEWKISFKPRS